MQEVKRWMLELEVVFDVSRWENEESCGSGRGL